MKLKSLKMSVSLILSLMMALCPVLVAAAPIFAAERSHLVPEPSGAVSARNFSQNAASYFDAMLSGGATHAFDNNTEKEFDMEKEVANLAKSEALDPLMTSLGTFAAETLEDDRLKVTLNEILDEIAADERLAELHIKEPQKLVAGILRDERLINILGNVIADRLRDDNFILFVEQITSDLAVMLQHGDFRLFLKNTIMGLLHDEEINQMVAGLLDVAEAYPNELIENLLAILDDERFGQFRSELIDVIMTPMKNKADALMEDPRVKEAIELMLSEVKTIPPDVMNALMADAEFKAALDQLIKLFTDPLMQAMDVLMTDVMNDQLFATITDDLLAALQQADAFAEVNLILQGLNTDLSNILGTIGDELNALIGEYPPPGQESFFDSIAGFLGADGIEAHATEFMNYWSEVAGWSVEYHSAALNTALEPFIGSESPYIPNITAAANAAVDASLAVFMNELNVIFADHKATFNLDAVIDETMADLELTLNGDGVTNGVMQDAIATFPADQLMTLVGDRQEVFMTVLGELVNNLPLDNLFGSADGGGGETTGFLTGMVFAFPFDALADLITAEDIDKMLDQLFVMIGNLPLEDTATYLQENADKLGHDIASGVLNAAADALSSPGGEEPPVDPGSWQAQERAIIMDQLLTVERMRQLYLDLGGTDANVINDQHDPATVMLAVIMEIAGRDNRLNVFLEDVMNPPQSTMDELIDFGGRISGAFIALIDRIMLPAKRLFDPERLIHNYRQAEEDGLLSMLDGERINRSFSRVTSLMAGFLTTSEVAALPDGIMRSFLVDTGIVQEIVAAERFTVMADFAAEIVDAEPLKDLAARSYAGSFLDAVSTGEVIKMRDQLAGLLKPAELSKAANEVATGLIDDNVPQSVALTDFGVTAEAVVNNIVHTLKNEQSGLREMLTGIRDELLVPATSIPHDLLQDQRTKDALGEILAFPTTPTTAAPTGPAIEVLATLLDDDRLNQFLVRSADRLLNPALQVTTATASDPRLEQAMEELIVGILSNTALRDSLADLVGDLLADVGVRNVLKSIIDLSRRCAANATDAANPASAPNFHPALGNTAYPQPFNFRAMSVALVFTINTTMWRRAANNGLFYFTQVLMEWLSGTSPHASPSVFFRQYISDYLGPAVVRPKVADPIAAMLAGVVRGTATDVGFQNLFRERIYAAIAKDSLGTAAGFLRTDHRLRNAINQTLLSLPAQLEGIAGSISGDQRIAEIMGRVIDWVPAEDVIEYVETGAGGENLRGIIGDTAAEIDKTALKNILHVDEGLPGILTDAVHKFPADSFSNFLKETENFNTNTRAYNLGYTVADIPSRFMVNALDNAGLVRYPGQVITGLIEGADYTIGKRIFNLLSRLINNENIGRDISELLSDTILNVYNVFKNHIRSLSGYTRQANQKMQMQSFEQSVGLEATSLQTQGTFHLAGVKPANVSSAAKTAAAPQREMNEMVALLNNFNTQILRDERLPAILDEIIGELLKEERFKAGLQNKKELAAAIIRDERLVNSLGEVISDFLQDERFAADIELVFTTMLALMSDESLNKYIRDALSGIVGDERVDAFIDSVIAGTVDLGHGVVTGVVSDVAADERVKSTISDLLMMFVEPAPGLVADIVDDERVLQVTGDVAQEIVSRGAVTAAEILENPDLKNALTELVLLTIDFVPDIIKEAIGDVRFTDTLIGNMQGALTGGTIDTVTQNMVAEFLYSPTFQNYMTNTFTYITNESMTRATNNTPTDNLGLNLQRQVASGMAEVPPDLVNTVLLDWLVHGHPYLPGTYLDWALAVTSLLSPGLVGDLGAAGSSAIRATMPGFVDQKWDEFVVVLQNAVAELNMVGLSTGIQNNLITSGVPGQLALELEHAGRISLDELARFIREDQETMNTLTNIVQETVNELPLTAAAQFIADDPRIAVLLKEAFPELPLPEIAAIIKEDDAIAVALMAALAEFPIEVIIGFLQDEGRADLVGYTLSDTLMGFIADLVEAEDVTDFTYDIITETLDSMGDSPGTVLFDNLAKLIDQGLLGQLLDNVLNRAAQPQAPSAEMQELYLRYTKEIPNYFTGALAEIAENIAGFFNGGAGADTPVDNQGDSSAGGVVDGSTGDGADGSTGDVVGGSTGDGGAEVIEVIPDAGLPGSDVVPDAGSGSDEVVADEALLQRGDVNGDSVIDTADAILVLQHVVGLVDLRSEGITAAGAFERAMVFGGSNPTVRDAIAILRYIVGLQTI